MATTALFYLFAVLAIASAISMVLHKNPLYSAISLVGVFIALSCLYITLAAPFIAVVQVLIYAGAIMVLVVFVILLLNLDEDKPLDRLRYLYAVGGGLGLILLVQTFFIFYAVMKAPNHAVNADQSVGNTMSIGEAMYTEYLLPVEIVGVVSNHPDFAELTSWYGVPFHHLPVAAESRAAQEETMLRLFDGMAADYLILARYMQILSPELTARLAGRCINIHHSFLPSFKGARPYRKAHERGVKLIGATAHFVTSDLDEGPIIEQAVERVDHRATEADLVRIGRDIEAQVLARAVRWTAERRVFLNGMRTVVFR